MYLVVHTYDFFSPYSSAHDLCQHISEINNSLNFKIRSKSSYVKGIILFICGLTFASSYQLLRSNAIAFLSSSYINISHGWYTCITPLSIAAGDIRLCVAILFYFALQVIGFPSQILGYMLCVFVDALGVDVTAEIETKDVGAESKVPLEDLRKKAVDVCLRNGQFQHMHFTQASSLSSSLDSAWRRHDLARYK